MLSFRLFLEDYEYRGEHIAPDKESGAPLYDLTKLYPEDIYSGVGARYYGEYGGTGRDLFVMGIILQAKGKPNFRVTIYRAVPKILNTEQQIDEYEKHKKYILKYGKVPPGVKEWSDSNKYYTFLHNETIRLQELEKEPQSKITINPGDWVTIDPQYAKDHGQVSLQNQYKILRKTVFAKQLFTAGDSLYEWGYIP